VAAPPAAARPPRAPANGAPASSKELLASALTRMGYRPAEADRAISALGDRVHEAPLAELVKEALALLVK
jgi:Holliday junction DNA helicase RuvA